MARWTKQWLPPKEYPSWENEANQRKVLGEGFVPPKIYPDPREWDGPYFRDFPTIADAGIISSVSMQLSLGAVSSTAEAKEYPCALGRFKIHEDAESFTRVIEEYILSGAPVALDIETSGLDPYVDRIRTVQVTNDGKFSHILLCEKIGNASRRPLQLMLERCPLVLHNCTFDLSFLLVFTQRFPEFLVFDTLLAAQDINAGLYEGRDRAFGLGALSKKYLRIKLDKSEQKNFAKAANSPMTFAAMAYAANDTLATWRLAAILAPILEEKGLVRTYRELDLPCCAPSVDIKVRGVPVDKNALLKIKERDEPVVKELEERLAKLLSVDTRDVKEDVSEAAKEEWLPDLEAQGLIDPVEEDEFSLEITPETLTKSGKVRKKGKELSLVKSHQKVLEAFHRMGYTDLESTGEGVLGTYFLDKEVRQVSEEDREIIREKCEAAAVLLEHRELSKGLDYIVQGFLGKYYNERTGCVHPNLNVCGSLSEKGHDAGKEIATGRFSSSNPNLQNVKSDQEYRDIFRAPKGYMVIKTDASQQEVRVMAEVSGDRALRQIYLDGKSDVYREVASRVLRKPVDQVTGKERKIFKVIVLAIGYGASAKTVSSGAGIPIEEAQKAINDFFKAFPGIKAFIDTCENQAKALGYLQNKFSGRRRHWNHEKLRGFEYKYRTQAANFLIQGGAADCGKKALLLAYERLSYLGCRPLPPVHDEMVFIAPEEKANEALALLDEAMVEGSETFLKVVPMKADGAVGKTWKKEPGGCDFCNINPEKPKDWKGFWPREGFEKVTVRKINEEWIPICDRCYIFHLEKERRGALASRA